MHNESLNDHSPELVEKTSKLQKVKNAAIMIGLIGVPTVIGVASTYYSLKIIQMNYEAAALNLEAATVAAIKK